MLPSTLPLRLVLLLALLAASPAARAGAISGVCPDGSIFIVQRVEAIPCRKAKRVEPGDIPPLNPEFLPRPYGWDVFSRRSDPNNPYNLVDSLRAAPPAPSRQPTPPAPVPGGPSPVTPGRAAAPAPAHSPVVALSPRELDDLAAIVDVLQERAPATLVQRTDAGPGLQVRLAHSAAFEAKLGRALAARGTPATGPVVAFHVLAQQNGAFWGNLTFVQDHMAYHPDTQDPAQFGLVDGRLGKLVAGDRVLGYAVLPAEADASRPLDVYWNDRRLTATLNP